MTNMVSRNFIFTAFFSVIFFLCIFTGLAIFIMPVVAQTALPEESLANLVKPSVVRIAEHISGTARIPRVKVDIRKRLIALVPDEYTKVPVDEYLVGSGFIIHPGGYIATNAHVVSRETVKQMLASESALSALYENALFLSDAEMQDFIQSETDNGFSKQVIKYVIDHGVFELESKVAVLHPDSEKRNIHDLIDEGFPAQIVSVNDNFLEDEKDVALLKIEANNLPSLSLGNGEELVVGEKAYIFGFPATADLGQGSSSEATFTRGIISAIKQSANKDFRIFQTDAKVSAGSSGGPLFDERGEVKGIITFQTDELSRAEGDNFAFALPIALVKAVAEEAGVIPAEGSYNRNFKSAFQSFNLKRCDKAKEVFHSALDESNNQFVSDKYLDVYFKKCDELQKRGKLEILLNEWQNRARAIGNPIFYLVGIGLIIFGIFGALLFWILREVRREEKEIEMLETRLRIDEAHIKGYESTPYDGVPPKREAEKKSANLQRRSGRRKKIV